MKVWYYSPPPLVCKGIQNISILTINYCGSYGQINAIFFETDYKSPPSPHQGSPLSHDGWGGDKTIEI